MGENNQGGQKRVCLSSLTFLNFHVNPISGLPVTEEGKMRLINVAMQLRSTPPPPLNSPTSLCQIRHVSGHLYVFNGEQQAPHPELGQTHHSRKVVGVRGRKLLQYNAVRLESRGEDTDV